MDRQVFIDFNTRLSPDDYSVCLSSALRENEAKEYFDQHFGCIIGRKISLPAEYLPNRDFLAYHKEKVIEAWNY